jgi:clan AA aspartic protease
MGHQFAEIGLSDPRKPQFKSRQVNALADTGALMLCIPEHVALQLDLQTESQREVTVTDDRSMNGPYVGPLRVAFENNLCFFWALVMQDKVLLGGIPIQDMDLSFWPSRQTITVNPNSPNIPLVASSSAPHILKISAGASARV